MKVLKSLLEEGGPNVAENPHHRDIYRHIYDLIWQGVRDKVGGRGFPLEPVLYLTDNIQIKREQVVQCLGELIALNSEVANLVTDIIASKESFEEFIDENANENVAVVDTETGLAEDKKDERSRLTATVREIERFLSDGLVKVGISGE